MTRIYALIAVRIFKLQTIKIIKQIKQIWERGHHQIYKVFVFIYKPTKSSNIIFSVKMFKEVLVFWLTTSSFVVNRVLAQSDEEVTKLLKQITNFTAGALAYEFPTNAKMYNAKTTVPIGRPLCKYTI